LADHLVNAATEDDLAALPGTVSGLARELVLAGTGMATVSAMTQAARQVAARRRGLISAAAFAGLPRLVSELGGECTRILLHRRAVTISRRPQEARDWFDVSVELLRAGSNARSLRWLEGTEALAACLALWGPEPAVGPASLELVGTFHLDDLYRDDDIGPVCPAGAFPPAPLLVHRDEPTRYVTYLLPVRTTLREWGFLAVVGPVWAPAVGTRDIYYEWSTLLSMALDHEQTVVSLREQRENFAQLYDRQTALAGALQKSGERYALASKATNDGLWDWQLDSDQVYYSRRFLELLGFNASLESVLGTIDDWLNAVCEEDRPILVEKLDQLRQTGGTTATFELELRVVVGPDEVRWVMCKAVAARGADQVTSRIAGSLADITGRKGLEERLSHAALHDALTGLANRTLLAEKIRLALARHEADPARNFAILWLDLDRFKIINDSMGHRAGDALLKEVARRLRAQVRGTDIAGRYGGDEFVVLVDPMPVDYNELEKLVKRLQSALAVPYMVDGREISVSVSVGIVTSAAAYDSTEDILRDADLAMYSAKQAERGTYAIFTTHMRTAVQGRLEVATDLRHALVDRELVLHYQPIMELGTKRVISLESLVRWPRADGRMTPPVEFLPTACEAGLMPEMGDYIFKEACAQQVIWHGNGLLDPDARLAVNVSHEEFWHGSFLPNVDRAMAESGAEPFVIEITEGIVMDDVGAALSILQELRDRGFQLHVDDFGTGRSSLEALRDLPVDALKIDRSFIREMGASSRRLALVRAVVQMADALGLTVIAEGIETEEEARLLMEMGCPHGQGYWLARPMGAVQASERLRELSHESAVAAAAR
jgi:diguanylate cyclase (GGDEF)-like protein